MKSATKEKLRKILMKNARLFNMKIKTKKDGYFLNEDFHLFTLIENEIFSWELQMTIDFATEGRIHLMMFLHPVIITTITKPAYIKFANAANLYLSSAMGRFWVNDDDFCYEASLPEFLLEYEKELEDQLFDKPFAHFRDCLSPLMKMKNGEWNAEYAIKYLTELRENGYVDNQEYNLW
ncbi:MAG: hypothetical protein Q4D54_04285 [Eubacteriales bacterium]|nr:hypothetical protein [Eubacteriales bacterium]